MAKHKRDTKSYYKMYQSTYREIRNIMSQVNKAGYSIDANYYQDILATNTMDYKKGFQALKQLSNRGRILENVYRVDTETGERVPITRDIYDRVTSIPKSFEYPNPIEYNLDAPRYAEIAVANFKNELAIYDSLIANKGGASGFSEVTNWFNSLLREYGTEKVGRMLMEASEHGVELNFAVMYDNTSATNFITEMMTFLQTYSNLSPNEEFSQLDEDIMKSVYGEITDGERLMEDEDGNPII